MKKLHLLVIGLFLLLFSFSENFVSCAENIEYRVCVNEAGVFAFPDINSEKIETLYYNDIVLISDEIVNDENTNIKFYKVIRDEEVFGYVIITTVAKNESVKYKLQTNATLNKSSVVYIINNE